MLADLFVETLRSLRAHRLRFGLTSMGIVWGVAMLTYLAAFTDGYELHFDRELAKVGQKIVFLFPGVVTKKQVGHRGTRPVELELEDIERIASIDVVSQAAPNLWLGPRVMRAGRRTKLIWAYGASEETGRIRNFEVAAGRGLSRGDVADHATVVFLGDKVARRLFGSSPAVGRTVRIDGVPFRVVGVSKPKGQQLIYVGPADDEIALIPVTTAQRRFTRSTSLGQEVIFAPRTRAEGWSALRAARAVLGLHHDFVPRDETAMGSFNIQEVVQIIDTLLLGLRLFLNTASLITLLVGAAGVMNIMFVVVTERTKEIGLRKAIGASNRAVFAQFLSETLVITVGAGLIGALLGWLAVRASGAAIPEGSTMVSTPVLLPESVVLIALTLMGVGIASGILPALRASRTDPAISLRAV
jgi:putative ABC transport system permease protein